MPNGNAGASPLSASVPGVAAEDQQDVAEVSTALRIALQGQEELD